MSYTLPTTIELKPIFDRAKSFYKKAIVANNGYQVTLYSYNTHIADIIDGQAYIKGEFSQTTMRHLREFLAQYLPEFDTSLKNIRENIKNTNASYTSIDDTLENLKSIL